MENKIKKVDIEHWKRKITYKNFINYSNPTCSITTRLDVTGLVEYCKKNQLSFFTTFLYFVSIAVNQVEEMRTRINGDEVVIYEKINPSYIIMRNDGEIMTCCSEMQEDFDLFYRAVRKDIENALNKEESEFNSVFACDCIYVSCLPWVDLRGVINPYNYEDKASTSIPRIAWGKYTATAGGTLEMGMDISVHHALADGRHIALVFEKISDMIKKPEEFLGDKQ